MSQSMQMKVGRQAVGLQQLVSCVATIRAALMMLVVLLIVLTGFGCTAMQDAIVDRHSTMLAADLQTRGQLERAGIEREYETYRASKLRQIDAVYDEALKFLELQGKLTASSSRAAAERFAALRQTLNGMVDQTKAAALQQTVWYDTAAKTVLATVEYRQQKDQALIAGLQAGLESFAGAWAATKGEPTSEAESKGNALIDQFRNELTTMLGNRLGVVLPAK